MLEALVVLLAILAWPVTLAVGFIWLVINFPIVFMGIGLLVLALCLLYYVCSAIEKAVQGSWNFVKRIVRP